MNKLIDAHCHIGTVPATQSICGFIVNAVTESDWAGIISLARANPGIYPALGLHPWYVANAGRNWDCRLIEILTENPNIMIGECGLDKLHPHYELQMDIFTRHLEIASLLRRSVNIHCVRAWDDVYRLLRGYRDIPVMILHGFAGTPDVIRHFVKMPNVYFSFGRGICDARYTRTQNALRVVPKNRILIESDSPITESDNILQHIAADIVGKIDINTEQIYKNTMEFLNYGQTTQD